MILTPLLYRILVVASMGLALAAGLVDVLFPSAITEGLSAAQATYLDQYGDISPAVVLAVGAVLVAFVITSLVAWVGLLLFSPWAPRLTLIVTVLGTLMLLPMPAAMSGLSFSLMTLSSMLLGAVLAASYWSPLSSRFVRASS